MISPMFTSEMLLSSRGMTELTAHPRPVAVNMFMITENISAIAATQGDLPMHCF